MASCTYNKGLNGNPYAVLTVTQSSQNIANNTSVLAWDLKIYRPYNIQSSASKAYSVTINGTKVKSGTTTIGGSGTKTIASGTVTVPHNSNGTKTVNFSFSLTFDITWSGTKIGTGSASGSITLTTIPRASKPSCITYPETTKNVGDIGSSFRIHMNRATSEFTHYVYAKWGTKTVEIGKNVESNIDWKIPENFANEIPNATSGIGTIYVDTYSGSTKIGSASVGFTATVPSSYKPSVSALTAVEAVSSVAEKVGALVKGLSKLKITATGAGSYGSTIKSYKITVDGATYNSANITTDIIQKSGTITVKAQVTDSRGRVGEKSITVTVYNYEKPRIDNYTVARCNSDGTLNEDGTYVKITVKGSITTVNSKNTGTLKFYFKSSGASAYSSIELKSNVTTINESFIKDGYNTELSYNTYVELKDEFNNTSTKSANVGTAFTLVDYYRDGKGIAFGKVATLTGVADFNLKIKANKGIIYPEIPINTDFNDLKDTGIFKSINQKANTYVNCPVDSGTFLLEIYEAGNEGQLFQRLTTCFKDESVKYERFYYQSAWGAWHVTFSQECFDTLYKSYTDTGWIDLTLTSGISHGSEGNLRARLKQGVLYIQGSVKGINANYKHFASLPSAIYSKIAIPSRTRFTGVYNIASPCVLSLYVEGSLWSVTCPSGTFDATKMININMAIPVVT